MQAPPEQLEALENQRHPYFQQPEEGCAVSAAELIHTCHSYQLEHGSDQNECVLQGFPSLQQIEDTAGQGDRS